MRLINTTTFKLEEFNNASQLQYAILSHRWEEEELSLRDVLVLNDVRGKRGYDKFRKTCHRAHKDGYSYVWIDTCCIDKDSSAELSEAINSMFRWYQEADVCYAYLCDVKDHPLNAKEFCQSQWFCRGWTLQELLAPKRVAFFNSEWELIGWKHNLVDTIASATGIRAVALTVSIFTTFSISERMSWAAGRKTTRIEDSAYSLMGLFNVNMPLLYGEGPKAFMRLQEEIVKHSDDQTIFAWSCATQDKFYPGLLAASPDAFGGIPLLEPYYEHLHDNLLGYSMTNKGLSINLELMPWAPQVYLARLRCSIVRSPPTRCMVGIFLSYVRNEGLYRRVPRPGAEADLYKFHPKFEAETWSSQFRLTLVNVPQVNLIVSFTKYKGISQEPELKFRLSASLYSKIGHEIHCCDNGNFHPETRIASYCSGSAPHNSEFPQRYFGRSGRVIVADLSVVHQELGKMLLGFGFDFQPICVVSHRRRHQQAQRRSAFAANHDNVQKSIDEIHCMEAFGWDTSPGRLSFPGIAQLSEFGLWAMKPSTEGVISKILSLGYPKSGSNATTQIQLLIHQSRSFSGWEVTVDTINTPKLKRRQTEGLENQQLITKRSNTTDGVTLSRCRSHPSDAS